MPVLLEDATIPLEFRLFQALDLREWNAATEPSALQSLHDAVHHVGRGSSVIAANSGSVSSTESARRRSVGLSPTTLVPIALLLLVLVASVWYRDAFYRETLDYYANVTKRWGASRRRREAQR